MSVDIEKLKKTRGIIRGSTTKIINKLESEISKQEVNFEIIEESLAQLIDKESALTSLDNEIHILIEIENLDEEILSTEEYRDKIIIWKTRANRCLKGNLNTDVSTAVRNADINSASQCKNKQSELQCKIKLPRLEIESFNGDVCSWPSFWAQFKTAIHENENLNDVDRFNYLISVLNSEAATSIRGLTLSPDNYKKAIKILEDRFGRRELLIDVHMNKLLNLTPVRRAFDSTGLRTLYDQVEIQIRGLETIGIQPNSYGCLLFPILIKMIPKDLALEFTRIYTNNEESKITDLLNFLKKEVESRERAETLTKHVDPEINSKKFVDNRNFSDKYKYKYREQEDFKCKSLKPSSSAALNTLVENCCIFCDKVTDHKSDDCNVVSIPEKKDILKRNGRCFLCFKKYHRIKQCRIKIECSVCHKRHRKALCEGVYHIEKPPETVVSSVMPIKKETKTGKRKVLLQTVQAIATGLNSELKVRCLFDGGSQRTFVREDLSKQLKLPVTGEEVLSLHTFGKSNATITKRRRVKLKLCNSQNKNKFIEIEALETPDICSAIIEVPSKELSDYVKTLDIKLSDFSEKVSQCPQIDILFGSDYYWQIVSGKVKRFDSSIMLIETLFGWSIQGSLTNSSFTEQNSVGVLHAVIESELSDTQLASTQLKAFWELDSIGIVNEPTERSVSDDEAIRKFESTVRFRERYEVRLPWKFEDIDLPNNYDIAKKRFELLLRKFQKHEELYNQYKAVIDEYIKLNIVEEIPSLGEYSEETHPIYYLPHHPVIRRDKETTNLRIVFDASSHAHSSPSLNDLLHPGPNLNPDLLNLLLKFRLHAIAVVADIEKAFLQISLSGDDRDATRFLWIDGIPQDLISAFKPKILRMTRVLFGVTSSPFLLAAVIKTHVKKYEENFPNTCSILNESMYVDDLLSGASDVEKAYRMSCEAREILLDAKMSLRKWQTNSSCLKELWKEADFEMTTKQTPLGKQAIPFKVLGLIWDPEKDIFKFDVSNLLEFIIFAGKTKRSIIKASGRIFDPAGFISPFTVRVKILFQELWEQGVQWDENLPQDIELKWNRWCEELPELSSIQIPRHYFDESNSKNIKELQIHCFTDASEKAYGAVVYLRYKLQTDIVKVVFLCSKSRIAPLKKLSVPRLELMGALIGTRLVNHIKTVFENFSIQIAQYFWTDSNIVLCWIRSSPSKWKPFVANRVGEVQSMTEPENWRHCPGYENPADMLTRGKTVADLLDNSLWSTGPTWLKEENENWPQTVPDKNSKQIPNEDKEIRYKNSFTFVLTAPTVQKEVLFSLKKYSKLSKVLRVTSWILRFINNVKKENLKRTGPIATSELELSENYWIRETQTQSFPLELNAIANGKEIEFASRIKDLNPFLDSNNLMRVGGRLQFGDLSFDEKHPILLPDKNDFSELQIKGCHEKVAHGGVADTLVQIRERMWILRARQQTKSIIKRCCLCKKFNAKQATMTMAPLPPDRVLMSEAFSVTGIDFAGPIYVKEKNTTVKAYIALFTCANTRAVHLELVSDLTTETFILAFKRFISRRGICKVIYSDNAKTFKAANAELKRMWKNLKNQRLSDFFGSQGITWKFIVPRAAWWGGFWERLVRTVKTCLKKILGRALLKFEELSTILSEVEAIVNSRPITYHYNELREPLPLTPAHFLVGKRLTALPRRTYTPTTSATTNQLRKRLRYQENLMNMFWKRWKEHYVLELRSNHYRPPSNRKDVIKLDSIVLINEDRTPRHMWNMGRVTEVFKGRDGNVRSCAVKLSNQTVLKRPIQLLYPLEIEETDDGVLPSSRLVPAMQDQVTTQ